MELKMLILHNKLDNRDLHLTIFKKNAFLFYKMTAQRRFHAVKSLGSTISSNGHLKNHLVCRH